MGIRDKLRMPPSSLTGELGAYLTEIAQRINAIPTLSFFSGTHPNSSLSAYGGDLCINVSPSSSVSRLFINYGSTTTRGTASWRTVA